MIVNATSSYSSNEASLGPPRWVAGCRRSVLLISTRQAVRRCPHPPAAPPRNWPLGIGRQATRLSDVTTTVTFNEVLGAQGALDHERLDRVHPNAYLPNLQDGGQGVN